MSYGIPWLSKDDQFIVSEASKGASLKCIADGLQRTEATTYARARRLGVYFKRQNKKIWTDAELDIIRRDDRNNIYTKVTASTLGVSLSMLADQRQRMGASRRLQEAQVATHAVPILGALGPAPASLSSLWNEPVMPSRGGIE